MKVNLEELSFDLEFIMARERDYAPWMAKLIIDLPKDPAFKKLSPETREQIEIIKAAVE